MLMIRTCRRHVELLPSSALRLWIAHHGIDGAGDIARRQTALPFLGERAPECQFSCNELGHAQANVSI